VPVLPFKEDGLDVDDIRRILDESGIGLPAYYEWRTRSGCYFCFFQRKAEWVGLLEKHPELYKEAMKYEKIDEKTGQRYTWTQRESLAELADPKRVEEIKQRHQQAMQTAKKRRVNAPLIELFDEVLEDEGGEEPCSFCHS
jgi:hypothetical protein